MENPNDIQCPVCGYYCLGRGGFGCIDKPVLVAMHFVPFVRKDNPAPLNVPQENRTENE